VLSSLIMTLRTSKRRRCRKRGREGGRPFLLLGYFRKRKAENKRERRGGKGEAVSFLGEAGYPSVQNKKERKGKRRKRPICSFCLYLLQTQRGEEEDEVGN